MEASLIQSLTPKTNQYWAMMVKFLDGIQPQHDGQSTKYELDVQTTEPCMFNTVGRNHRFRWPEAVFLVIFIGPW